MHFPCNHVSLHATANSPIFANNMWGSILFLLSWKIYSPAQTTSNIDMIDFQGWKKVHLVNWTHHCRSDPLRVSEPAAEFGLGIDIEDFWVGIPYLLQLPSQWQVYAWQISHIRRSLNGSVLGAWGGRTVFSPNFKRSRVNILGMDSHIILWYFNLRPTQVQL